MIAVLASALLIAAPAGTPHLQSSLLGWAEADTVGSRHLLVAFGPGTVPAVLLSDLQGIEALRVSGTTADVRATPRGLSRLLAEAGVVFVGSPFGPLPLVQTDALPEMRVPESWARGRDGTGVRVGVIDLGFEGYTSRLGRELPERVHIRSFYDGADGDGDLSGGGVVHGTACAEVVHDIAPGAELYLANVSSDLDLERAVDWMTAAGVEVISHSLAWFVGGGDGSGPVDDIVEKARRNGILWVTAAGNFAQSHWGGPVTDTDHDGLIELDGSGDESIGLPTVTAGHTIDAILTWNRWPTSADLSFAIEVRQGGVVLASSEDEFAGSPWAFRSVEYAPRATTEDLELVLRHVSGDTTGVHLRLFRVDGGGSPLEEHAVSAGSLAIPAESPHALSVGAYRWQESPALETLEVWSSFGPSLTGLAKPEILGPDRIQNSVYANRSFAGTSAACPHVAGAAAVLLSAAIRGGMYDLHLDPDAIRGLLENEARLLADRSAPEGSTGWGCVRLVLDRPASPALVVAPEERGLRFSANGPGLRGDLRIVDARGRLLAHLEGTGRPGGRIEYHLASRSGLRAARGRYWAILQGSGASVSFFWPGWR